VCVCVCVDSDYISYSRTRMFGVSHGTVTKYNFDTRNIDIMTAVRASEERIVVCQARM